MSTNQHSSEAIFENIKNFDEKIQREFQNKTRQYSNLNERFDKDMQILWLELNPKGRQCFSIDLLKDMRAQHELLLKNRGTYYIDHAPYNVRYQVLTSPHSKPYNLGGDLELFLTCIKNHDRSSLYDYAKLCVDVLSPTATNFDSSVTTISLVRGQALGGGFESALSSSIVVAERSAKLGLPEVLFNLFPGMGAYHFLSRRLPLAQVEKIIMSGNIYNAEELYDMGVIDILAEDGKGEYAIHEYVNKHKWHLNSQSAMQKVREIYQPITREDLMSVCEVWVDSAMCLGARDLKTMERLVKAQYKMHASENVKRMKVVS